MDAVGRPVGNNIDLKETFSPIAPQDRKTSGQQPLAGYFFSVGPAVSGSILAWYVVWHRLTVGSSGGANG